MKQSNYLPTGQIVNTHGLKGYVKVMPWADAPDVLLEFDRFFIDGREYAVEYAALCLCREDVELEEGTVFIADLIGLPVLADGREIGKITEVLTPPGNDVYVVKGSHEYMIPAVKEFVEEINVQEGYVKVRLIEGMQTDAD